ncbi:MAG: ABC transporter substrate-binding protein [Devosia sp.]
MLTHRLPLLFALAAGAALLAPLTTVQAQSDMLELKLATADVDYNPTTDSVLKLAAKYGLYEKHGVKVEIVPLEGTPQVVAALNSGAVDLGDISIEAAIRLRAENGIPIKGLVAGTLGAPFLIAAKSEITSVDQLVGKSYAISDTGGLDHTLTQLVLKSMNVAADGPAYVAVGAPAARVQALAAGKVDATTASYGTFLAVADAPGIHILVQPEDFSAATPGLSKFVTALESTIENKHEALQRFVDALVEASRLYATNPDQWVSAMTEVRDDLPKPTLEKTATFLADRWCVYGCLSAPELEKAVAFIYSNPDLKDIKAIPSEELVDRQFLAKAIETLGPAQGTPVDKP